MTATQAPTPGPLTDSEQVAHLAKTLDKSPDEIRRALASLESKGLIRLAPTAPVEASGSEREVPVCHEIPLSNHMKVTLEYDPDGSRTAMLWNEANEPIADGDAPVLPLKTDSEVREQIARCVELAIVRHGVEESALEGTLLDADAILALRPQPSGETREAVARIIADHVAGGFDAALQDKQEWKDRSGLGYDCEPSDVNGPFKDDYLDAADAILALLSARPLALGGQQGDA